VTFSVQWPCPYLVSDVEDVVEEGGSVGVPGNAEALHGGEAQVDVLSQLPQPQSQTQTQTYENRDTDTGTDTRKRSLPDQWQRQQLLHTVTPTLGRHWYQENVSAVVIHTSSFLPSLSF